MALFEKKTAVLPPPEHIAIIMDGNGRWAKNRAMPRTAGHKAGAETLRRIADYCHKIGVKYLTVYAFSTENWKRSEEEVAGIMRLLKDYLLELLADVRKNPVRVCFFGDLSRLSPELQELCEKTQQETAYYECRLNFCLNYGGRDEIVRGARLFAKEVAEGKRQPEELTEALFSTYLYSSDIPDPELIIRPSGELRTSNFLPWQSAYSEYVFMNVLWPDFREKDLDEAIAEYHRRNRRFGGV